jgi:hypothetical protein
MGLGDLYADTASLLGDGLEWYALPRGGELDAESQRPIDDAGIGGEVHTLADGSPSGHGGEWRAGQAAPAIAGSNTIRAGQEGN